MKPKVILFFLILIGLFTACNNRPKEVLSDEKMEAIMVDLFLFEGAATVKNIPVGDTLKTNYYNQLLQKHGVTLAQYDSSLVWYLKNPKLYVALHERVLVRLDNLEKDIKEGKYIRPIAPNDSLDSMLIHIQKREYFLIHDGRDKLAKFTLKDSSIQQGDTLKLAFQARMEGDIKDLKTSSKIIVYYSDSTEQIIDQALKLDNKQQAYHIVIPIEMKKKVDSLSVDLFKHKIPLNATQRVYIFNILMQRIFNSYREMP